MENILEHVLKLVKNLDVSAKEKTEKKKGWLLSRQYLKPLNEPSDDEDAQDDSEGSKSKYKRKLICVYEAAKYGMKEGVLSGVFLGGCWGIFKYITENFTFILEGSSENKSAIKGDHDKKDREKKTVSSNPPPSERSRTQSQQMSTLPEKQNEGRRSVVSEPDEVNSIVSESDGRRSVASNVDASSKHTIRNYNAQENSTAYKGLALHGRSLDQRFQSPSRGNHYKVNDESVEKSGKELSELAGSRYSHLLPNNALFKRAGEKVEIVGYAFIHTTGSMNSGSGSIKSDHDGSDSPKKTESENGEGSVKKNKSGGNKSKMSVTSGTSKASTSSKNKSSSKTQAAQDSGSAKSSRKESKQTSKQSVKSGTVQSAEQSRSVLVGTVEESQTKFSTTTNRNESVAGSVTNQEHTSPDPSYQTPTSDLHVIEETRSTVVQGRSNEIIQDKTDDPSLIGSINNPEPSQTSAVANIKTPEQISSQIDEVAAVRNEELSVAKISQHNESSEVIGSQSPRVVTKEKSTASSVHERKSMYKKSSGFIKSNQSRSRGTLNKQNMSEEVRTTEPGSRSVLESQSDLENILPSSKHAPSVLVDASTVSNGFTSRMTVNNPSPSIISDNFPQTSEPSRSEVGNPIYSLSNISEIGGQDGERSYVKDTLNQDVPGEVSEQPWFTMKTVSPTPQNTYEGVDYSKSVFSEVGYVSNEVSSSEVGHSRSGLQETDPFEIPETPTNYGEARQEGGSTSAGQLSSAAQGYPQTTETGTVYGSESDPSAFQSGQQPLSTPTRSYTVAPIPAPFAQAPEDSLASDQRTRQSQAPSEDDRLVASKGQVTPKGEEGEPGGGFNLLTAVNDNIIVLSACNCAVVLGVVCSVITTTRASLSI